MTTNKETETPTKEPDNKETTEETPQGNPSPFSLFMAENCAFCSDTMWQPPCGQCETHPCERGRECWANPPLHLFPYETYYANALGENYLSTVDLDNQPDYDEETPNRNLEDLEVRLKQKLRLAGNHPSQLPIVLFAEACD